MAQWFHPDRVCPEPRWPSTSRGRARGAIRALRDANLKVPEDVSVIGFDDIQLAAFHTPRLTTIRQPLRHMGESAARILVQRLQGFKDYPSELAVPPELIIRETTAPAKTKHR
jgi:DNA-binding LacI/PurR family transcriptional regulator